MQYSSFKRNISSCGITSFKCNIHHSSAIFIIQVQYICRWNYVIQMQYSSFKCNMQHSSEIYVYVLIPFNTSLNNFEIVSYRERVCSIHAPSPHPLSLGWFGSSRSSGIRPPPPPPLEYMYKGTACVFPFICLGKIFQRKTGKGCVLNQSPKIWGGFFSEASREIKKKGVWFTRTCFPSLQ